MKLLTKIYIFNIIKNKCIEIINFVENNNTGRDEE